MTKPCSSVPRRFSGRDKGQCLARPRCRHVTACLRTAGVCSPPAPRHCDGQLGAARPPRPPLFSRLLFSGHPQPPPPGAAQGSLTSHNPRLEQARLWPDFPCPGSGSAPARLCGLGPLVPFLYPQCPQSWGVDLCRGWPSRHCAWSCTQAPHSRCSLGASPSAIHKGPTTCTALSKLWGFGW